MGMRYIHYLMIIPLVSLIQLYGVNGRLPELLTDLNKNLEMIRQQLSKMPKQTGLT